MRRDAAGLPFKLFYSIFILQYSYSINMATKFQIFPKDGVGVDFL